ncbi:MAG TPA: mechanosensitive ion channel domain-containing protein, partial [Alphaproteobacteria bacterium]|nr:mechanosensitive ion channel domain-containing protein [Alphaproteobacteria bacterium]
MEQLFDIQFYYDQFILSRNWLVENALALSIASLGQLLVIGLLFLAARLISKYAQILLSELAKTPRFDAPLRWISTPQRWIAVTLFPIALPILWLILQWLALAVFSYFDLPNQFIRTAVNLIAAWIVIRFSTSFVRNAAISRIIAGIAWTIAALNIVGLLTPTVQLLDSQAFNLGGLRISAMTVINALLSLSVMLWLAIVAERFLEQRVMSSLSLSPSMQVLIVKLFKIFVVAAAVLVALYAVGIDLTVFAVFSGAIGIGIGFGLQKAVANFVSGITILVERSIKLGDVISVGETYGWVNTLGARFVSVLTRDGIEYLIPNEDLLTQQVI